MSQYPQFYDSQRIGTLYYPDAARIAEEAAAAGLPPASADARNVHLLLIDMQVDFCHPSGSLYVPGALGDVQRTVEALASQAAVAIDNQNLIEAQKALMDSLIKVMAHAIDAKSPYTGGHCQRVPELTKMLAGKAMAATEGEAPDVFPVDYRVLEQSIVFRTAPGTKLTALTANPAVTLQADRVESETRTAWSVVAKGRAAETTLEDESVRTADRLLFPSEPGTKDHIIRIDVDTITGRRFKIHPPDAVGLSLDDAMRAGLE